jgi:predicted CXXCH cytochrome family protein
MQYDGGTVNGALKLMSVVVLVGAFSTATWAAVHPVPLDPKADPASCLQCHEDKTKGKSVHSAIAMGCTSCHQIRVSKDVTRVTLTTPTPLALCLTCHADKKAADIKGKVHPPAVRDCLKCHDPHTTDNKNQLLKPASGDSKDTNLCLECHTIGVNVPKDGSRHAALDMGCDGCHITHKTGERGAREFDYHLTKDAPALCLDCHDVKDAGLIKAHQGQPFGTADCLTCHDPHESASKHLMAKYTHSPFAGGQCDACHAPAKDGKVVLTAPTAKEICLGCHSDKGEQIEKAKVQHPGAAGDCTDCHSPHAGNFPYFPKPNPVAVCLGCHTDQAEQGKKAHPHQPAFEQGCGICHDPHGNDNLHLLRAKTPNALCLECHGPDSTPAKLEGEHVVTIFDGKVKLPDTYFDKVVVLPIRYGSGHPVKGHPIGDIMDPKDISKVLTPLSCWSCHQPHSSAQADLLIKDEPNNMAFCDNCHKNRLVIK